MAMRLTERPKSVPNTMPLNRSRTALVRRMSVDPVMPSFIAPKMPMLPKQKAETRVMMFTMYVSLPQCLLFARRNSALMHLARKDSAKTSSPMTEPTMRAMTTTGSAEALFTRVEPMHSVITPKMRGSVSLTRFGMNPEKRVPASPPTKRAQLSVIGPIIILNLLK